MSGDQIAAWRKALAARTKAARRQRGKHRRQPTTGRGMIRRAQPPPKEN